MTGWLFGSKRRGATVLNGDQRPGYLPKDRLEAVATYQVPMTRSLEHWTLSDTTTSTGCPGDRGAGDLDPADPHAVSGVDCS